MSNEPGIWEQMLAKRAEWAAEQPSLNAELKAMGREAVKDIRNTVHETFFGQHEGHGELGTPLNPTPQMTTQDLGTVHGAYETMLEQYASRVPEQQLEQEIQR